MPFADYPPKVAKAWSITRTYYAIRECNCDRHPHGAGRDAKRCDPDGARRTALGMVCEGLSNRGADRVQRCRDGRGLAACSIRAGPALRYE
jgi:hypothetical protein